MKTKQSGFHAIELAVVVLVVGLLGFAGYKVWDRSQTKTESSLASQTVPSAPEIKTTDDLTTAEKSVDQVDISSGTTELDSLDAELSSLQ